MKRFEATELSLTSGTSGPERRAALVAELGWLRRLAGGLVGESAADDLTQEVLVVALRSGPPFSGLRLRGWLRVVARRVAGRQRSQEEARMRAQGMAAQVREAEEQGQETGDRLEVYALLVTAIQGVEEPYRTALVLRYEQQRSTREIADELGLSPSAARKRVSRGLALLRARLGDRLGLVEPVRRNPLAAIVPLPFPQRGFRNSAMHFSGWTAMTSKITLGTAAASILIAIAFLSEGSWRPSILEGSHDTSAQGLSRSAPYGVASVSVGSRLPGRGPIVGRKPLAESDTDAHFLFVQTPAGNPATGARAAIVVDTGHVAVLSLSPEASAFIPPQARGQRLFASAPGFGLGWVRAPAPGELPSPDGLVLTLEPEESLVGKLIEDGGPPLTPVFIELQIDDRALGTLTQRGSVYSELEDLGLLPDKSGRWTASDGSFHWFGLTSGTIERLCLSRTHRLLNGPTGDPSAEPQCLDIAPGTQPVTVYCTREATVRGRLVLGERGQPVEGPVGLELWRDKERHRTHAFSRISPNGVFEIPFEGRNFDRLILSAMGSQGWDRSRVISLGDGVWHGRVLDIGQISLSSFVRRDLLVLDPGGVPIAGAGVASGHDSQQTDSEGLARLVVDPGETIEVIASGFALCSRRFEPARSDQDGRFVLRLEPGVTLRFEPHDGSESGSSGPGQLEVRLSWETSPFEVDPNGGGDWPSSAQLAFQRGRARSITSRSGTQEERGSGSLSLAPRPGCPIEVPGLIPGSRLRVALVDLLGQELIGQELTILDRDHLPRDGVQVHVFKLEDIDSLSVPLAINVRSDAGLELPFASVFLRSLEPLGGLSLTADERGRLRLGLLAPRAIGLEISAPGYVSQGIDRFDPVPSGEPLEVRLQPSRDLRLTVVDQAGKRIESGAVVLSDERDWHLRKPLGSEPWLDLPRVPRCELELTLDIGAHRLRTSVPRDVEEFRVVTPIPGRLTFSVDVGARPVPLEGVLHVEIEPLESSNLQANPRHDAVTLFPGLKSLARFDGPLFPGRYRVRLTVGPKDPESIFVGPQTPMPTPDVGHVLSDEDVVINVQQECSVLVQL